MTIRELETYRSKIRQLDLLKEQMKVEYLSSIDPARIRVQNGNKSDPTAELALREISLLNKYEEEYNALLKKVKTMQNYILGISDNECREIALRRFIKGQSYEEIGKAMFMHRSTAFRKLKNYVAHNAT